VNASLKLEAKPQKKNGDVYWNVFNFGVHVKNLDGFKVRFDNLFNGDEALSKYKSRMQPHIALVLTLIRRRTKQNICDV
jgi:hypothetical protein